MAYEIGLSTPEVPNRGFPLWIVSVVGVILAGLCVLSRLAIRFHHSQIGLDDWVILASLVSAILLTITECCAVNNGYGKHSTDLTHKQQMAALGWFFGAQITYKIVIAVNKLSFLCLYLRIFPARAFRWTCYGGLVLISVWGLVFVFVTIFQCKPISSFWDKSIKNPQCLPNEPLWMSFSVINIIFDLAILALPIYPLSQLRLPRAKKIGLLVVFGMGAFVCVATIVRTTTLVSSAKDKDPTSGPIPATIWSVVEAHTGIICTCLPVFRYPLQFLFPKLFHSQQNSTPYGYSFNRNTPRRTPLATSSERNLNDTNDDAWHGKARGFSEDLPKDALEMMPTRNGNLSPAGNITKVTDVQISYDQRSDASSCPIRSREF